MASQARAYDRSSVQAKALRLHCEIGFRRPVSLSKQLQIAARYDFLRRIINHTMNVPVPRLVSLASSRSLSSISAQSIPMHQLQEVGQKGISVRVYVARGSVAPLEFLQSVSLTGIH
jgi:hypothetical protein